MHTPLVARADKLEKQRIETVESERIEYRERNPPIAAPANHRCGGLIECRESLEPRRNATTRHLGDIVC